MYVTIGAAGRARSLLDDYLEVLDKEGRLAERQNLTYLEGRTRTAEGRSEDAIAYFEQALTLPHMQSVFWDSKYLPPRRYRRRRPQPWRPPRHLRADP